MKLVKLVLVLLMLLGCSQKTKVTELNHDELMAGDFSSIAGEYINNEGDIYKINELGVRDDSEYIVSKTVYNLENFENLYLVSMGRKGDPESGCLLIIIPEGVTIRNIDTDTTKIRIYYGQDYPTEKNRIYVKKEE